MDATEGWFAGVDPDDPASERASITDRRADRPRDWPALAVESGFADDRQLKHALRAMDDTPRVA